MKREIEYSDYVVTEKGLMYIKLIGLEFIGVYENEKTKELNFLWI